MSVLTTFQFHTEADIAQSIKLQSLGNITLH